MKKLTKAISFAVEEDAVSRDSVSQKLGPKSVKSAIEPFYAGWSKKELIETEEIKLLRRET